MSVAYDEFFLLFCVYQQDPFIALAHLKRILPKKKFYIHGWWDDWIKFADAIQKKKMNFEDTYTKICMYIDRSMKRDGKNKNCGKSVCRKIIFLFQP